MNKRSDIESVKSFWDTHPLFAGEINEPVGTKAWFLACDRIKTNDIFAGDVSAWTSYAVDGRSVLDVGCGPGYWNRLLGAHDIDYHGVDLSVESVRLAKASQEIFDLPGKIAVGNAESLDVPDESFDYVLSEGVIHHTPNTQQCVDEIYRVLRTGGYACVSVYYKNYVLRHPCVFKIALKLMSCLSISLEGRGREEMCHAENSDDFVRMYDGNANPIGKAYTKDELQNMFHAFSEITFERYYIPSRIVSVPIPPHVQRILATMFGLMILVKVKK